MLDLARTLCCENEYREAENLYGTVLEIFGGVLSNLPPGVTEHPQSRNKSEIL
jgi:hypothetical protein